MGGMANPYGNPDLPAGTGRRKGVLNKTTKDGRLFARSVLEQVDGEAESVRLYGPVARILRRQIREGVGPSPTQMPSATFNALMDRAYGKVVDRMKLDVAAKRPYEGETDDELASRAEKLSLRLKEKN